jgi:hypothetical protein
MVRARKHTLTRLRNANSSCICQTMSGDRRTADDLTSRGDLDEECTPFDLLFEIFD